MDVPHRHISYSKGCNVEFKSPVYESRSPDKESKSRMSLFLKVFMRARFLQVRHLRCIHDFTKLGKLSMRQQA